tara:strand:- start:3763 stop:4542 length:780 start_codon:yes stop_codon:yes gene_type:complete
MKASILIANYNSAEFIEDCINSLINQSYKNIEIVCFDDASNDNSLEKIKKFKNVKLILNEDNKKKYGSYNQINSYKKAFQHCSGDIIFFLDSDDYFKTNKVEKVINKFKNDKNAKIIFDLPIFSFKDKKILKKKNYSILNNYWPFLPPQSCIAISRKYISKLFDLIDFEEFPNIWMDFRIGIASKYIFKQLNILDEGLTFYRQSDTNISSNFKILSKNWWKRRLEAHKYVMHFFKEHKISHSKNFDYLITNLVNKFYAS